MNTGFCFAENDSGDAYGANYIIQGSTPAVQYYSSADCSASSYLGILPFSTTCQTGECFNQPSPSPTYTPTTGTPSTNPTPRPTLSPSCAKTPTSRPTQSAQPTPKPTSNPTTAPVVEPTFRPSARPTNSPLAVPTYRPTPNPTLTPSLFCMQYEQWSIVNSSSARRLDEIEVQNLPVVDNVNPQDFKFVSELDVLPADWAALTPLSRKHGSCERTQI